MGRSGTSAITRALVLAGFYAGADAELMGPHPANPVGLYENLGIYQLNESILERTGGRWFAPPTSEAQAAAAADGRADLEEALAGLRRDAAGAPLAIKDPRIGVLLEVWGPLIARELHPVLAVRNPVEVALSLSARDETPTAFALASWELHTARLLAHLRNREITVAPYRWLLDSREAACELVALVVCRLSEDCARRVNPELAGRAIEPDLHRNRVPPDVLGDYLTAHQRELWAYLQSLPAGTQRLTPPEGLLREPDPAHALIRAERQRLDTALLFRRLSEGQEHERARAEEAEAALAHDRVRLAEVERRLSEIRASGSWRVTAPLRALRGALRQPRARLFRAGS